eukprot:Transcript_25112.p2 GENE.Transcript_25112~~Transcript_25112.p2  ORF type:complete len:287 (+),score=102.20 Transcript_25112:80-940(+)
MGKKKKLSPEEQEAAAAAARAQEAVLALAMQLERGPEEARVEAARAFCIGGTLAANGIHAIGTNPWPFVEPAIAPLVAVVAREAKDEKLRPARAGATEALHDLLVQSTNVLIAGQNPISDAIVAAGGIRPLVEIARGGEVEPTAPIYPQPRMADTLGTHAKFAPSLEAEHATELLCCLALTSAHRAAIVAAGGHEPLLRLAREGTSEEARERGAFALGSLAFNQRDARAVVERAGGVKLLEAMARDQTSPRLQRVAEYAVHNLKAPLGPPPEPAKTKEGKKGKKKK